MAQEINVKVPDIGGASHVDVIEILVKSGDSITIDTPLITLESDKASMEIPSPYAGIVDKIQVVVGDKISEGDIILSLLSDENTVDSSISMPIVSQEVIPEIKEESPELYQNNEAQTEAFNVFVPDIGGATHVDVIDILVSVGEFIKKDQSIITLEGDKATMDIPAPADGIVKVIALDIGDKVSQDSLILIMEIQQKNDVVVVKKEKTAIVPPILPEKKSVDLVKNDALPTLFIPAGPAVRRMARELGVNLAEVRGSGRKSRISKEDIQTYVKSSLAEKKSSQQGFALPEIPIIDFGKFGEIDVRPLNKIKRLTAINVHRSWISIPHVTQFDEADITDLEAFRKSDVNFTAETGTKLTILAFVTKVVYKALVKFPQFNASLDPEGEHLIYKNYYNIGIAVETPNGLVVPVIKQVNQLSVGDIAKEMAALSKKAREKTITPNDMSGGCFTISSLGGIGGTAFTPIVNSPEVAILGLSRAMMKPIYENNEFKPRLILPLSLSYDHRVIDGAEAARFTRFIADSLSDIRRILV